MRPEVTAYRPLLPYSRIKRFFHECDEIRSSGNMVLPQRIPIAGLGTDYGYFI